jgi:hypothetical protein
MLDHASLPPASLQASPLPSPPFHDCSRRESRATFGSIIHNIIGNLNPNS